MRIIDSRDKWPFPAITEARKAGAGDWVEISEEAATDLMNVLPPIYIPGGFMLGEAAASTPQGEDIYTAVIRFGGRYFARDLAISKRNEARDMLAATLAEAAAR